MFGLKAPAENAEHTGSYYAASANLSQPYSRLETNIKADVVIVGGGFSGVNTLLELTEKGFDAVLLEANRIAWGATGRNGGQIIGGIGSDPDQHEKEVGADGVKEIYKMGWEAGEIIRERVAKYNIECDLKWGYCDVALKPRHLKWFEQWYQDSKQLGAPWQLELLDGREVKQYVGSDSYLGGLYNPSNGHIHPINLCTGEAKAAAGLGARIYEQSKVRYIQQGQPARVITDHGSVEAKWIVLCGNAYMENLVPHLAKRVLPSNSCIIATEPLSPDLANSVMPSDVAVCDPRTALDYFRLSGDKRMLFGGLSNYTGLEPSDLEGVLRKKMLKVFPQLESTRIDYGWSGQLGIGLNRTPQMGSLDDNILYVQAYSGHGVAPTHMMARVLANKIAGDTKRFDIFANIKHPPFPGGKWFRRPALAIGMAYFKVLDAF
jgi:glycine/D-amino acid oxidase-like deaminating enzyme